MQVGRDRCRGGHGVRQPEMEGELRAFGQRAEGNQADDGGIPGVCLDLFCCRQYGIDFVTADDMADQQHAAEHGQTAHAGDGERHARAGAGILAVVPVGDQHE